MNRILLFFLLLATTAALTFGGMLAQNRMAAIVEENGLVDPQEASEGMPPVVAFTTVALGGFRGLLADLLWLRAIQLQDEGKYYELAQLADWIMKLQPKFSGAAMFLGWNMAYNVSVACKRPEDRWRWVNRGIETIREAIEYDANNPQLYRELGWIYQHKLGNMLDDAQQYYKSRMAKELLPVFGTHYPDWEALAAAPSDEAAFRAAFPPGGKVADALSAAGLSDWKILNERFRADGGRLPEPPADSLTPEERTSVENALRAFWLKSVFKLDPAAGLAINKEYGELDWLLPESFAIYWASLGLKRGDPENLACRLMILQCLAVSFGTGRMLLPEDGTVPDRPLMIPNTDLADSIRAMYRKSLEENLSNTLAKAAYENFLIDSAVTLFAYGKKRKALEFFEELRKETGNEKAKKLPFEQFILNEWEEDVSYSEYKQTQQQLTGLLYSACLLLGYGEREAAQEHFALARRIYERYLGQHKGLDRLALPSFDELRRNVVEAISRSYPEIERRLREEAGAPQTPAAPAESAKP